MVHAQNMVIPWHSKALQKYHVHKNSTLLVCQYKIRCIKCCWSQVSQDLPFLHPSETSVLNRLCKMGTDYVRFTEFIEQHTGHVHQQVIRAYAFILCLTWSDQDWSVISSPCFTGALLEPAESVWASWHLSACVLHWAELYAAALSTGFTGPWKRGCIFGVYIWSPYGAFMAVCR